MIILLTLKIILFSIFAPSVHFSMADPIVETNYGKIQGFNLTLENGLEADIFLRVPFAQAPIENLRFEVSFSLPTKNRL